MPEERNVAYIQIPRLYDSILRIRGSRKNARMWHCQRDIVHHSLEILGVFSHILNIDPAPIDGCVVIQGPYRRWPVLQIGGDISLDQGICPVGQVLRVIMVPNSYQ